MEKKQIEEITELLWHYPKALHLNSYSDCEEVAKLLYEEGYRKQNVVKKDFYTPEEVRSMSPREVRENIEIIRRSMKMWR